MKLLVFNFRGIIIKFLKCMWIVLFRSVSPKICNVLIEWNEHLLLDLFRQVSSQASLLLTMWRTMVYVRRNENDANIWCMYSPSSRVFLFSLLWDGERVPVACHMSRFCSVSCPGKIQRSVKCSQAKCLPFLCPSLSLPFSYLKL